MPASIKDVAKRARVSSATVSRVLAGKPYASKAVIARVLQAVEDLNYRPNRVARSLRIQKSHVIGLVISDIQNSFFSTVVRAVEETMHEAGYSVFLCNSNEDEEREQTYLNLLQDEQVAGIILTPTQVNAAAYSMLIDAGIPLTIIDRKPSNLNADTVVTDNKTASEALITQLLSQGHKRIAAIFSLLSISTGEERLKGYNAALKKAGISFDPSLVHTGKPIIEDGYCLAKEIFQNEHPSAVFTASKLITLGVLRYLYDHKIRIPEDIEIAAFDTLDWMPNAPKLIIAEQPAFELGTKSAQLLLARIQNPNKPTETIVLPSTIKRINS